MAISPEHFPVIKFIVQVCFSASVLAFTMVMLATGETVEIYLPVLTGLVGYWLPQPSLKPRTVMQQSNTVP